ncbi:MAG: NAD(+) diphosphatase [Rhodospirillaceae bacterium]
MTIQIKPNLYAGGSLDRAPLLRKDEPGLAARMMAENTRLVPVWRSLSLIDSANAAAPRLVGIDARAGAALLALPGVEAALLGLEGDSAVFALDLGAALEAPESHPALAGRGAFIELRSVGALLPAAEASLAAYARGLMWWHQRHRFCGVCGAATRTGDGGHVRACTSGACATTHFPRTDPAVIMLVHDGDRCVLGRQPRFAPGLYSTLAGFVEPGESLEEAVAREVFEEVGLRVTEVGYVSSQPWPFPSSLMLGFYARAGSTAITVQPDEIEHARWFSREELLTAPPGLPRADSISRRLIEMWLGR